LLGWKWDRGEATLKADFGDPTAGTAYAVCLYDQVAEASVLRSQAHIVGAGMCGTRPCWQETGQGFRYSDGAGASDGIVFIALKQGLDGRAQIAVKGYGDALDMPVLPLDQDPTVIMQLKNDLGTCWEASFAAPASRNTQIEFRDKSD
jgi:hypothetical protein